MDTLLNFLLDNSFIINAIWWITIGAMALLFLISYLFPYKKIAKVLPLTIMFNPKENLDLNFQSVGYEMMHTTFLARSTHYTIFVDAFLWFVVFTAIHPIVGILALVLMAYQSMKIGEISFTVSFIFIGILYFSLALLINLVLPAAMVWVVATTALLFTAFLRFIGHLTEPAPPLLLEESDQFVKISLKNLNWKVLIMPFYGFVAEFASGLPSRLFIVQVNFFNQMLLGLKPKNIASIKSIKEKAKEVNLFGYNKEEKLDEYYHSINH